MAVSMSLTPFAMAALYSVWQGKRARLCLAQNSGSLTKTSTTSQWDAAEISGNGYSRYIWTVPAGAYDATLDRFQAAIETATFTASANGGGLNWNAAYLVLGTISGSNTTWDTSPTAVFSESPSVALAPGEPRGYAIRLLTDEVIVAA